MPIIKPAHEGYFADPFVLLHDGTYYAYGTGLHGRDGTLAFEVLTSTDLQHWTSRGGVLEPVSHETLEYWAPEVAYDGERFYMYYSAGVGDKGHFIRVAVADSPLGPFRDAGVNLTPDEPFAIDPSPYRAPDGQWYLYFAKDFVDGDRPGTGLAVAPMRDMLSLAGPAETVLRAGADWQLFMRQREMYGGTYDWHTLEGPFVVFRDGQYHCFYSGGAWMNETYGVGHATADHPLGPWREARSHPVVLSTRPGVLIGPGHNSIVTGPDGRDHIVFHAWNEERTLRQLHVLPLIWTADGPYALTEQGNPIP